MNIDQELRRFIVSLAQEAGKIAAAHFRKVKARRKIDGTLVTEADEAASRLIDTWLRHHFPTHAILSEEESTRYDPAHRYTWVVDPLDGTTNFARGLPIWGVSIALLEAGAPVAGAVAFPMLHETYSALRGGGAFFNDMPLEPQEDIRMDNQHILALCSRSLRRFHVDVPLKRRMLGSAAYHMLSVASASALAALECTPKVWDLAAAHLVITEAGGTVAHLDGTPVFPLPAAAADYAQVYRPVLAAVNQEVDQRVRAGIEERGR